MIEQIKLALASSTPVVIGFYVRRGFGELTPTNQVDYDINTPLDGGHAVVALGYDKEGLIVENSWGTYWGNKGFGKLSWAVVAKTFSALTWSTNTQRPRALRCAY